MTLLSLNPTTEHIAASFEEATAAEVEQTIAQTDSAFRDWRAQSFPERRAPLERAAAYLRTHRARFAALMTAEMGKPIVEAEAEVDKCAWACEFFAENAERFLLDSEVETGGRRSLVVFEPLGTVLAIMPWNFHFWQVFRFAAPAIMAGNAALVKHAPNVPRCALAIEEVFRESGFPAGLYRNLFLQIAAVGQLIRDPRVRAVTLTGSVAAGAAVAAQAGAAVKKTVLELGGSDPFIVLEDADVEEAARTAVRARNQNSGQSCIAAKRFIVVESVADAFVFVNAIVASDPRLPFGGIKQSGLGRELSEFGIREFVNIQTVWMRLPGDPPGPRPPQPST